ncbi:MAG: M23 family metallopeptidase [Desulfovibrionaceae bacterium]
MKRLCILIAFLCWASTAQAFELALPLACTIGPDCFVQNHFDADPGKDAADYTCGSLTYDGHIGTDFRIPRDMMDRGVPVLAATDGVVLRTRDGMPDVNVRQAGLDTVNGRGAGNSVIVDHGDGWSTQYSHLRQGSVAVKPGDSVAKGQQIGLVGLSGMTEFPHVELVVRYHGMALDPFVGVRAASGCGGERHPLWDEATRQTLVYLPSGVLGHGFAASPAGLNAVRVGRQPETRLASDSRALVFWASAFGVRAGDVEMLAITTPDGRELARYSAPLAKHQAQRMHYVGKRLRTGRWPVGTYTGSYTLTRMVDGVPVAVAHAVATAVVE